MVASGNAKLIKRYHKRKAGLFKKVWELSTLCDVKACVIAYGSGSTVPETWPPDPSAVVELIRDYQHSTKKRSANEEVPISKKQRIPLPSDKGLLDGCSPELLRQMMVELDERLGEARSWMQILKGGGGEEEKPVEWLPPLIMEENTGMQENVEIPQPMLLSHVPAGPTMSEWFPLSDHVPAEPTMSEWFPLLDQGQQLMNADGGSCYYANGNSSNSLGFASQGFVTMQCKWQCRVPMPL